MEIPIGSKVLVRKANYSRSHYAGEIGEVVRKENGGRYHIRMNDGIVVLYGRNLVVTEESEEEEEEREAGNLRDIVAEAYERLKERDPKFKRFVDLENSW